MRLDYPEPTGDEALDGWLEDLVGMLRYPDMIEGETLRIFGPVNLENFSSGYMGGWAVSEDALSSTISSGRFGNLNGFLDYTSNTFGIGIGNTGANMANFSYDSTNGLRLRTDTTEIIVLDNSGNAYISGTLTIGSGGIPASTVDGWAHASDLTMIDGGDIYTNTVTATQIAANTITASEIAANTITAAEIAANTITASEIYANTITASEVAANTITASEIAANTITAAEIAASTITTSELAANTIIIGDINSTVSDRFFTDSTTQGNVEGWVHASDVTKIDGGDIYTNTVTATQIAASTITTTQLAANTILVGDIDSTVSDRFFSTSTTQTNIEGWIHGSDVTKIDGGDVYTNTITATQIAANTITASQIYGNTITASEIAGNTITASEIAGNTITASEIAGTTITAAEIAANTITAGQIFGGTITAAEITGTTLSAIYVDMGTITAGNITLNTSGFIRTDGKDNYADTTAGIFFGYDTDAYKLNLGDATDYIKFDGSAVAISSAQAAAITIKSGGDLNIESGGDINFVGSSYTIAIDVDATGETFSIEPDTADEVTFSVGATNPFEFIKMQSADYTSFTSYTDADNFTTLYTDNKAGATVQMRMMDGGDLATLEFAYASGDDGVLVNGGLPCRIKTGTYTGDGSEDQGITGVGFQPQAVIVSSVASNSSMFMKIEGMTGSYSTAIATGAVSENKIISLDADGFSVDDAGTDAHPNKNTHGYVYIAWG